MSFKAPLVVLWACLMASAAIASESQRLCDLHAQTELTRLHEMLQIHEKEVAVLVVAQVDVTN
jgi:hypothetical protein